MNPRYYPMDWVDKLMGPRPLVCMNCDQYDDYRETLFEYPKGSWNYWCGVCFENDIHKEWDNKSKRWKKIRCECHNEIEVWDDHECMWVCHITKEREE